LSETIDRTFSSILCLWFCYSVALSRIVRLWLAVTADERVWRALKYLGSLFEGSNSIQSWECRTQLAMGSPQTGGIWCGRLAVVCSCWESPASVK
jgi:hypothetical protein